MDDGGADNGGILFLFNSTLHHNIAKNGGAVRNIGGISTDGTRTEVIPGVVYSVNSTFSSNQAAEDGGALYNPHETSFDAPLGIAIFFNTTITNNTADADGNGSGDGGGIGNGALAGNVQLINTIVAGNFDISSLVTDNNNNLIGSVAGAGGSVGTGTDIVTPNAGLGALQNNGGLTLTHAPLAGNAAIDWVSKNAYPIFYLSWLSCVNCSLNSHLAPNAMNVGCVNDAPKF